MAGRGSKLGSGREGAPGRSRWISPLLGMTLAGVLATGCANGAPRSDTLPDSQETTPAPEEGAGLESSFDSSEHAQLRQRMVERQIEARNVMDTAVLRAMRTVPRHLFVPDASPETAYSDTPYPIGYGQTISQPYIVAFMAEAARIDPGDRILEVGTGSGYGAAVLAELAAEVYTIEIIPELAQRARRILAELGYDEVRVRTGNGWLGWPENAPYDAVVVTAAPDEVPEALLEQLTVGGTLVVPVGEVRQSLRVIEKTEEGLEDESVLPVRFVPMVEEPEDGAG